MSFLLLGVLLVAATPAFGGDCCAPECAPAPCFKTVCVTEWVPQNYETFRTVYKTEYTTEAFTAYKTVCVPETRTQVITVNKSVPVIKTGFRTVYKCVPSVEVHTGYKTEWQCREVTTVSRKCVDQGYYACKEVCVEPNCLDKLKAKLHHECCVPAKTKTVKEWVPNKVWIETPHTHTERFAVKVPYTYEVTVNKSVPVQESFQYTTYTCVPEQITQNYTVHVARQVPYQATRTVAHQVAVQEKVLQCKLVPVSVEKQVPVTECCSPKKKHCH
jgi:hypothetical protein